MSKSEKDRTIEDRKKFLPYLKEVSVFKNSGIKDTDLGKVLSHMTFLTFPPGQAIINRGDEGTEFYVIIYGEVEVHLANEQHKKAATRMRHL